MQVINKSRNIKAKKDETLNDRQNYAELMADAFLEKKLDTGAEFRFSLTERGKTAVSNSEDFRFKVQIRHESVEDLRANAVVFDRPPLRITDFEDVPAAELSLERKNSAFRDVLATSIMNHDLDDGREYIVSISSNQAALPNSKGVRCSVTISAALAKPGQAKNQEILHQLCFGKAAISGEGDNRVATWAQIRFRLSDYGWIRFD